MKPHTLALCLALAATLAAPTASAQAARYIPYQGHLEHDGQPVLDEVTVTFSLYPAASGGSALHSESQAITPVDGAFSTRIGPVSESVFASPALYLGLAVDGLALAGRQPIETSPYAIRGQPGAAFRTDAVTLDNGAQQVTLAPTAGNALRLVGGAHQVTLTPKTTGAGRPALGVSDLILEYGIDSPRLAAHPAVPNTNQNHFGSGALSGTFGDPGGTIVIMASASAFTSTGPGRIQMQVTVDGVTVGAMRAYAVRNNEHFTLPPVFIRLDRGQFTAGTPQNVITRTVELRPINCTSGCGSPIVTTRADTNDFGNVMIIRLPTP